MELLTHYRRYCHLFTSKTYTSFISMAGDIATTLRFVMIYGYVYFNTVKMLVHQ